MFRLDVRPGSARLHVGSQSPGPGLFLSMHQLFQSVYSLPGCGSGRILDAGSLSILPLPALGGIPELALQLFCADEKATPKDLLRRGLDLFFCAV